MAKSTITQYVQWCCICGKPATDQHHTLFGRQRKFADEDGLLVPLCRECHDEVHHSKSPVANRMSRIIGQLAYEKEQALQGISKTEARNNFRKRYGESYL